jgi:hypothetical protein
LQPVPPSRKPAQLQTVIAIAILQWPVVPMTLALIDADVRPAAMLVSWCALVTATVIVVGVLRAIAGRFAAVTVAAAMSVYCTLCTALALYRLYTHEWLDLPLLLALPADSLETIRTFIGDGGVAAVLALLLAHAALYTFGAMTMAAELPSGRSARMKTLLGAAILVPCVAMAGAPHEDLLLATIRDTAAVLPIVDPAVYTIAPAEHVFLIQLESLNALAVNGEYTVDGKRLDVDGMPVMRRLASEGILFPHLWSPDVQTHRVQQAFLCGALRNLNLAPFFEQVPYEVDCLPELFANAGYKTVFLKGVENPTFANANKVMPLLGYRDIRFGEIMQPGDANHLWGYEEGIYFRRAIEYLERTYTRGERLFVHIAVSAHHVSYVRTGHNPAWFRAPHARQVAEYIASAKQQDAALAVVREVIDRYTGGNAHVFIFGDHSYPVGLYGSVQPQVGATVDNFVTPMLYLPPRARAAEFALGRTVNTLHGETDLAATIAELTSRKPHRNSLVPFMLRTPPERYDYERCHVMTQPFGYRSVMIAHGETAYVYSFATRCVETLRLTYDPLRQKPAARECDVKFEDFERRYMCARYRR